MPLRMMAERLADELDLTEEQRARFDEIVEKYSEQSLERAEHHARMRELGQEYRAARTAGDDQKAAEIREQMRELAAQRGQIIENFMTEVEAILEPAQVEKLREMRGRLRSFGERGADIRRLIDSLPEELDLTPEQRVQYEDLLDEHRQQMQEHQRAWREAREEKRRQMEEAEAAGDEERAAALREEMLRSRPEPVGFDEFFERLAAILTEEQRSRLAELRAEMALPPGQRAAAEDVRELLRAAKRLDLNEQQREKLKEIQREALTGERAARRDPQARQELAAKIKNQIMALLDDGQKADFEKMLKGERPGRHRYEGDRPPPGGRPPRGRGPAGGPR